MADTESTESTENTADESTESIGQDTQDGDKEPDYKALYEQEKANARKWQKRSKANRDASKTAAEDASKPLEEKVKSLENELSMLKAQREHESIARKVSKATGVPAELVVGEDEDEMTAFAEKIIEFAKSSKPSKTPADKGGAASGKAVTKKSILAIKDKRERDRAIAENIELFK